VVQTVNEFLTVRADRAIAAGIPAERVIVDAGLDLGKTAVQSLELLRSTQSLCSLGYTVLLSASNKTFLGDVLGLDINSRREAPLATAAIGISSGARVLRVHDVEGTRRVRDSLAAVVGAD
jgi:dihydropteroate synthase